jgi:hypothetical protein
MARLLIVVLLMAVNVHGQTVVTPMIAQAGMSAAEHARIDAFAAMCGVRSPEYATAELATVTSAYCAGFIIATMELNAAAYLANDKRWFCHPDQVTANQALAVVVKWGKEHPERGHINVTSGVLTALSTAFPCPDKERLELPKLGAVQAPTIKRDAKGRILRSASARNAFLKTTGYPKGRPGYVVDHIIPLMCGGLDDPINMQWQTIEDAKVKDKTEKQCR